LKVLVGRVGVEPTAR